MPNRTLGGVHPLPGGTTRGGGADMSIALFNRPADGTIIRFWWLWGKPRRGLHRNGCIELSDCNMVLLLPWHRWEYVSSAE